MTTISVLIPCYNAAKYVAFTLQSVLAQTWRDVEIIVVDDGSTDESAQVAASFRERGVKLLCQPNSGAAAARNKAFEESSGRYVLYLDADDIISPEHLQALVERLGGRTDLVAMSQWDRFRVSIGEAHFPQRRGYRDGPGVDWLIRDWDQARPMTQSGMFLVPRDLVEKHGGWNEALTLIDDFEFFTRILSRCVGIRFSAAARLYYRSNLAGSLSGRKAREALESAFLSISLGCQHLLDAEHSARTRRAAANIFQSFDYTYFPDVPDLRAKARERVRELGGADLEPDGPPRFHRLRKIVGWRAARLAQRAAVSLGVQGQP